MLRAARLEQVRRTGKYRESDMSLQRKVLGMLMISFGVLASAQQASLEEIVVTGMRKNDQPLPPLPAVTIRKRADFLLQPVELSNDTRDAKARHEELHQTLKVLAAAAAKVPGLSLAWQHGFLIPITDKDYRIPLPHGDDRDDTNSVTIYIKSALTPTSDVNAAIHTLDTFVADAKMTGRSQLEPLGDMALSVVNPERYRPEVIAALAASVSALKAAFGESCKVSIGDFSMRLQWQRSDVSELTLYLPYEVKIVGC